MISVSRQGTTCAPSKHSRCPGHVHARYPPCSHAPCRRVTGALDKSRRVTQEEAGPHLRRQCPTRDVLCEAACNWRETHEEDRSHPRRQGFTRAVPCVAVYSGVLPMRRPGLTLAGNASLVLRRAWRCVTSVLLTRRPSLTAGGKSSLVLCRAVWQCVTGVLLALVLT